MIISLKFLGSKFITFTKKNSLNYGIVFIIAFFILSATSFFIIENPINPNVNYFDDAIWYCIVSLTSTGYGDVVPLTGFGRFIGSFLMIGGIGFASFITASASSSFIENYNAEKEIRKSLIEKLLKNQEDFKKEIDNLKSEINDLKGDKND